MTFLIFGRHVDDRLPVITFDVPFVDGSYGLLLPKLSYYLEATTIALSQAAIAAIFAAVNYRFILTRRGSTAAFLIGFGVVIPIVLAVPFLFLELLGIYSKITSTTLAALPITVVLRTFEAMFGFAPPSTTACLWNYCLYYGTLMEPVFDDKTRTTPRATGRDFLQMQARMITLTLYVGGLCSLLSPSRYAPFPARLGVQLMGLPLPEILSPTHILNNFVIVFLTSLSLQQSTSGMSLMMMQLFGIKISPVMDNPIFGSASPRDFWGRRWNLIVHGGLKRGIYLPVRKHFSRVVAAMAVFAASGVMHEYFNSVLFYIHESDTDDAGQCWACYYPKQGNNIIFFSFCGLLLVLDFHLGNCWIFQRIKGLIPRPIVSLLLLLTGLPLCHLYFDDWVKGGYYNDLQLGFPMITRVIT